MKLLMYAKLTNSNSFFTREVTDGRISCSEYIFLKLSEGLLDWHCFRFRIKIKQNKTLQPLSHWFLLYWESL